jgi:hypothetical protein
MRPLGLALAVVDAAALIGIMTFAAVERYRAWRSKGAGD